MSPVLFNIYGEYFIEDALEDVEEDCVSVGEEKVRTIKYMDDLLVMAETEIQL